MPQARERDPLVGGPGFLGRDSMPPSFTRPPGVLRSPFRRNLPAARRSSMLPRGHGASGIDAYRSTLAESVVFEHLTPAESISSCGRAA